MNREQLDVPVPPIRHASRPIPVDSDRFVGHEEAEFYVGIVSPDGGTLSQTEQEGLALLRAYVYIDELHYLTDDHRLADGTEWDDDDKRSVHFGVLQNRHGEPPVVVGVTRLIIKSHGLDMLPVEIYFPEAFTTETAAVPSCEASRFIARCESKRMQHLVSIALIRAMMTFAAIQELPMYSIIGESFARFLTQAHLSYLYISEPKMLDAYLSMNAAARVDPRQTIERMKAAGSFCNGVEMHHGLGYFDVSMTKHMK